MLHDPKTQITSVAEIDRLNARIRELEMLVDSKQDLMWESIDEYEQLCGFKVNESFRIAWSIARTRK